eukprot:351534-Chlamydomonas_euryale.AAC.4
MPLGLQPREFTCMLVRGRGPAGRGRHDRPRPEAETSMFCARMTQPRIHERVNARTGPSCIQHR